MRWHLSDPETQPTTTTTDTAADAEQLVRRPRDPADNAIPSGTAAAARALINVSATNGKSEWRDMADSLLSDLDGLMAQHPRFAGWGLQALLLSDSGPIEVAVIPGQDDDEESLGKLLRVVETEASGRAVTVQGPSPTDPVAKASSIANATAVPLLEGRQPAAVASAHVCQDFVCQMPIADPEALRQALSPQS